MNGIIDLDDGWMLRGWHAWHWKLALSRETGVELRPIAGPVPARVPGSVQGALRDAGLIPDWNEGTRSLEIEWIENRHWTFERDLPAAWFRDGRSWVLFCEALDHAGVVMCGHREVGGFDSAHVPHRFDLGPAADDYLTTNPPAESVPLVIAFTDPPRNLGQVGRTSRIRDAKPRFYYGWDWTPRIVQTGICGKVRLEPANHPLLAGLVVSTNFVAASSRGGLRVALEEVPQAGLNLRIALGTMEPREWLLPATAAVIELDVGTASPWHPHGDGPQTLHPLRITLEDAQGCTVDSWSGHVGFRETRWLPCEGAPSGAEPWILSVNGRPGFITGVNWTPIRPNFADVTDDDYRKRLETYRELGFNLIRVWGGAGLERDCFYQICDELGLLVWQEFPYSSSGIDNHPPDDAEMTGRALDTARSFIQRRAHHPSLILWCGGNELQEVIAGRERPLTREHPLVEALGRLVAATDPVRRFLPTTPFGPEFSIRPENLGKGLHHCVHGPWKAEGSFEEWADWWRNSDALFHAEAGAPGASPAAMIRRFAGDPPLPGDASHPAWLHASSWWLQWDDWLATGGDASNLESYVNWSQRYQLRLLATAWRACRDRFPRCGGFIVWMGHDSFPCPVNTSILDFEGNPKPAAFFAAGPA